MKNEINAVLENMTTTIPEPEDYTGEDGLLYCGKCRKPKEAYFAPDKAAIFGRDRHPAECDCQRAAREEREAAEKRRRHLDTVEELKRRGFTDPTMRDWTFENDNGRNPQTGLARRYVEHWEDMRTDNIGCLFWGGVGTGKSYLAGCIANALMEKEIPVRMTNFALILNKHVFLHTQQLQALIHPIFPDLNVKTKTPLLSFLMLFHLLFQNLIPKRNQL